MHGSTKLKNGEFSLVTQDLSASKKDPAPWILLEYVFTCLMKCKFSIGILEEVALVTITEYGTKIHYTVGTKIT